MAAETILILGASVRAAAMSAARAGLAPSGIDSFADRDLQRLGPTVQVDPADYPAGLFAAADRAPPGPWMYTGGLENHPDLIDELARKRPLWGNAGDVLRPVRDPFLLHKTLTAAGFAMAEVRESPAGLPSTELGWSSPSAAVGGGRSRGGLGSRRRPSRTSSRNSPTACRTRPSTAATARTPCCWASPANCSASQLSPARAVQLVRQRRPGPAQKRRTFPSSASSGSVLAAAFGLVGLFGVDVVVDDAAVKVIEVNPRDPASTEVLEFAGGPSSVALHRAGCRREPLSAPASTDEGCVAKGVLYAMCEMMAPDLDGWDAAGEMPTRADVPQAGSVSPAGFPFISLLGAGRTPRRPRPSCASR